MIPRRGNFDIDAKINVFSPFAEIDRPKAEINSGSRNLFRNYSIRDVDNGIFKSNSKWRAIENLYYILPKIS